MPSVLDVVDNYFTMRPDNYFSLVSGRDVDAFGERVREYAEAERPLLDETRHPIYLGGGPSANFALVGGDLLLSSLLSSGQVLVRDPSLTGSPPSSTASSTCSVPGLGIGPRTTV